MEERGGGHRARRRSLHGGSEKEEEAAPGVAPRRASDLVAATGLTRWREEEEKIDRHE